MNLENKKIGIWGYGIVGKSLINYLYNKNCFLEVFDQRRLNEYEQQYLNLKNISIAENLEIFLNNDYIIPSPGIDLRPYCNLKDKFITELDLFYYNFKKPIIAITGSVGKTSITHILTQIFQAYGIKAQMGGNVGIGMCSFIDQQDEIDLLVLELSSFQLEFVKNFASQLSIITNIYPNHLNRHDNFNEYVKAKFNIFINQSENQNAILPIRFIDEVYSLNLKNKINFFSLEKPKENILKKIRSSDALFFIDQNFVYRFSDNVIEKIISIKDLPDKTFLENWLIIISSLYLSGLDLDYLNKFINSISIPEHRMEFVECINGITFYNDSKSTVPNSTLAAVDKLKGKSVILVLGGLSKGVDRSILIKDLKEKVKSIICFGHEAQELKKICDENFIAVYLCSDLQNVVDTCMQIAQKDDQVLFSPAGSSYDLFSNYQERGTQFKNIVSKLKEGLR